MRLIKSVLLVSIVCVIFFGSIALTSFLKEKYFYGFIAGRLRAYAETKWGGRLYIGRIKGNIFTNLRFENVLLSDIKNLPKELQLEIESVDVSYRPLEILWGYFDADFKKPRLIYKDTALPLDIHHHGRTTTLAFKKKFSNLDILKEILKKDVSLTGSADVGGEFILKNYEPYLFEVYIKSRDCQIGDSSSLKARVKLDLNISGKIENPAITGNIDIDNIYLSNGLSSLSLLKIRSRDIESRLPKKCSIDINLNGEKIAAKNASLNAVINTSLKLRKEIAGTPYTIGKIDILSGAYQNLNNIFTIKKGQILFADKDKSPSLDIEAETKIRRYKIFIDIKGALDDSYMVLYSKPELTQYEISSLLIFGKNTGELTSLEKKGLSGRNFNCLLINTLFLGQAEAKIAESLGLDDINFNFETGRDSADMPNYPSVEIGKYIVSDKLYGSYSIKPQTGSAVLPEQAVKSELALNDNILLKGERHWERSLSQPKEDKLCVEFRWKF